MLPQDSEHYIKVFSSVENIRRLHLTFELHDLYFRNQSTARNVVPGIKYASEQRYRMDLASFTANYVDLPEKLIEKAGRDDLALAVAKKYLGANYKNCSIFDIAVEKSSVTFESERDFKLGFTAKATIDQLV